MSGEPLVVTVLAGAVAYGAVVLLTRAVVPADLARLRRALSHQAP
jgi:hypothetical protein